MKKIIALALIFAISMTSFVFAENTDFESIKKELTDYGIMTDYSKETINRAEAAKIILEMKYIKLNEPTDTVFTDVKKEYWASGYIDLANRMGIVNGMGDGTFAPEKNLTNQQFVKMLVEVLGYGPMAKDRGGWPIGYMMVANMIGVPKGVDLVGTAEAKRSDMAVLIHNALDIPVMQQTGFGAETAYAIMNGTGGLERITLRTELDYTELDDNEYSSEGIIVNDDGVPFFNGNEYTGVLIKVKDFKKDNGIITFKNALKDDDTTYVVNENTYVWVTSNKLPVENIENGRYIQCWHRVDEKDNIELLKIEIMNEAPNDIN